MEPEDFRNPLEQKEGDVVIESESESSSDDTSAKMETENWT